MIATVYTLHGISLPAGGFISALTNARLSPMVDHYITGGAGIGIPQFTSQQGGEPEITFTTTQLKTILDLTGNLPCCALSGGNIDLYFRRVTPLGLREAGASTVHRRFRATLGQLSWQQIRARQRGPAEIDCRIKLAYDGTNAILVPASATALVGTPNADVQYTLGPAKLNGVFYGGVQEVVIDSQFQQVVLSGEGEINPTFVAGSEYAPLITLRSVDDIWSATGVNVTSLSSVYVFLRKRVANGLLVADGTATHISISNNTGATVAVDESGAGTNDPVSTGVSIRLVDPTSGLAPMLVTTAAAVA